MAVWIVSSTGGRTKRASVRQTSARKPPLLITTTYASEGPGRHSPRPDCWLQGYRELAGDRAASCPDRFERRAQNPLKFRAERDVILLHLLNPFDLLEHRHMVAGPHRDDHRRGHVGARARCDDLRRLRGYGHAVATGLFRLI